MAAAALRYTAGAYTQEESSRYHCAYKRGAENALAAGFDGVELHGAMAWASWIGPKLKATFGGPPYSANEKFTFETAIETVAAGEADAIAFGVAFIANPDLPRRFTRRL